MSKSCQLCDGHDISCICIDFRACQPPAPDPNSPTRYSPMPRQHHDLKTETPYYQAIEAGKKLFEARINDRNFQEGDMVTLLEVVSGVPTGRRIGPLEITYVLRGPAFGIQEGHCVFNWWA